MNFKYNINLPAGYDTIALIIHGGCFCNGDENYDQLLVNLLLAKNIASIRMDFRKNNLKSAVEDIETMSEYIKNKYSDKRRIIIGVSSGAYLAMCSNYSSYNYFIGICPVLDPYKRYKYLQKNMHNPMSIKMINDQLKYFKNEESMKYLPEIQDIEKLLIIGNDDINVPAYIAEEFFHDTCTAITYLDGGHGLCSKPTNALIDNIILFLQ